jgi:hypothetical protein
MRPHWGTTPLTLTLGILAASGAMGAGFRYAPAESVAIKIAGSAELSYTKHETLDVPDAPGHQLLLGQTTGTDKNTGPTDYFADASAVNVETADLAQGNGPHQGYYTMGKGADTAVAKWHGTVTTTMSPDKQPMTSFSGTWRYVHGAGQYANLKGSGTYKGHFLAQDRYAVTWEGTYSK